MKLTNEQLEVLNHMVKDGQAWGDNAETHFGLELGTKHMLAKVARHQPTFNKCKADEGENYKNRTVRDSEIIDPSDQTKWTAMQRWEFAMAKQERMGGLDRDAENLITDNPSLTVNQYTKTKYDAKIQLRSEKP
jgi:hypothetical protein